MAKIGIMFRHGLLSSGLLGATLLTATPASAQNAAAAGTPTPAAPAMTSTPAAPTLAPAMTNVEQATSPTIMAQATSPTIMAQASPAPAADAPVSRPRPAGQPVDHATRALGIETGSGLVVSLPGAAANIFVADPKVAEVRPASATSLFVFGVAPGRTTVAALDAAGDVMTQYAVTVRPSAFSAGEAASNISRLLHGADVHVAANAAGLVLTGRVATPADADQAVTMAKTYLGQGQTLENHLIVTSSSIVGLHVKIAEMNRAVTRQLGVNWSALGTLGSIGSFPALTATLNGASAASCALGGPGCRGGGVVGVLEALTSDGLVRTLAEPNLTARSGEAANFLVGGEYPIPVSQQFGTVTVDYKQYGIALSFVPTVLSNGRISLHVRPEVSQLSSSGAVTITGGISIPALTVRRAETTIELGSGDSFAIAGLLQDSVNQTDQSIPGIGDIPILGALFRSDNFQHNQTELVIIVTPYLVQGQSDPTAIKVPTDGYVPPNDIERMLWLRQQALPAGAGPLPTSVARIPGSAGFVLQ
jgi:pilus assembly protein CpaC